MDDPVVPAIRRLIVATQALDRVICDLYDWKRYKELDEAREAIRELEAWLTHHRVEFTKLGYSSLDSGTTHAG